MHKIDFGIYIVHAAFWGAFGVTLLVLRLLGGKSAGPSGPAPLAKEEKIAPYSRVLLVFHMVAFFTMYFGVGQAVFTSRVPAWFPGQRLAGCVVIASGAVLMDWTLIFFRSWRVRAKVDTGHELATGGPFRFLRHPIYMGLNLLALGTAIWIPTAVVWTGFGLMVIGSDLRGRAEEAILYNAFGAAYREYCTRTRRFLPGIY
ncbi:MAG TPA: isoprenylcysteine carboxylmethyltransferase family protein [Candidatus Acidoferrales bacterium]|jgi:protein-S-isoprenylcysteine O-methyltransferase Ste14|nr:isoprenylcysteine carboxylmethyltransferase family protein [Candidatus Acidoferrales bacterium]